MNKKQLGFFSTPETITNTVWINVTKRLEENRDRYGGGRGGLPEAAGLDSGEPGSKCSIAGNNRVMGLHIWPLKMYGKDHMQTWGDAYDKMVKKIK